MKTPEEYDDDLAVERLKLANADKNDGEKLKAIQDRIKKLELNKQCAVIRKRIDQIS